MVIYYDLMLLDDDPVIHRPHQRRRQLLERLVSPINGRVDIVWQKYVRFDRPTGPEKLKKALAVAFVQRWEGLVLKPSDEPYFTLGNSVQRRFPSRWIKLKKDCIKGLGDTADFAIVGAGYNVNEAEKYEGMNIRWTHFHVGCLKNKAAVLHAGEKPQFFVFDHIKDCIRREDMKMLTENGSLRAMGTEFPETWRIFDIELARGLPSMSVIFRKPFVFDIAGSGFDKSPNRDIFTLRFPRLIKVRLDKSWKECVDLDELQDMANEARNVPTGNLSDEVANWVEKLNSIDRGTRGQTITWDSTDDEEDDHHLLTLDAKPSALRSTRRLRTAAAPPLVRMDTAEIQQQEYRLSDGAVVARPFSKPSTGSIMSDGTLQTPPKSSPLSKGSGFTFSHKRTTSSSEKSPGLSRKRSAECDDGEEFTRNAKKARPLRIQHSSSEPKPNNNTRLKKPLHEMQNLSRPLPSTRSTYVPELNSRSKTDFSLVRKTPVITYPHFHRRKNTSKRCVEASSPGRATTASESTSVGTTQQSGWEESLHARLLPSEKANTKIVSFLTPPSMQVPNIKECDVMLSPCLIDHNHPVHQLLFNHFKSALTFPADAPTRIPKPDFRSRPRYELVILVERNELSTGHYVGAILHHIVGWHPRVVTFWDWRLLYFKSPQPMDEEQKQGLVSNYFVSKMWWDPRAKGQGAVVLEWCNSKPTLVLRHELDDLKWV